MAKGPEFTVVMRVDPRVEPEYVEVLASLVHRSWMQAKSDAGVVSRVSESGEELMVPFEDLSEEAKEIDRVLVRTVLAALLEFEERWPGEL